MIGFRWPARVVVIGLAVGFCSSCAVDGGGYGYSGASVDWGGDYYEPYGYDYGYWGPGYEVGPYRDHGHHDHDGHDGFHGGGHHAYRAAPSGRSMPSIPTGGRSGGGGHSGGGHPGGGGGGHH